MLEKLYHLSSTNLRTKGGLGEKRVKQGSFAGNLIGTVKRDKQGPKSEMMNEKKLHKIRGFFGASYIQYKYDVLFECDMFYVTC